jgi:hypothetical protein
MAGGVGWVSDVTGCLGVAVRFFGAVSRDGVFATGGMVLIGFFADFGGSLEWRSGQDKPSVNVLNLQRENGIVNGILKYVAV